MNTVEIIEDFACIHFGFYLVARRWIGWGHCFEEQNSLPQIHCISRSFQLSNSFVKTITSCSVFIVSLCKQQGRYSHSGKIIGAKTTRNLTSWSTRGRVSHLQHQPSIRVRSTFLSLSLNFFPLVNILNKIIKTLVFHHCRFSHRILLCLKLKLVLS